MKQKTAHEPRARVMSADEVWRDSQQVADVLIKNLAQAEPLVRLQIPLSLFLAALDGLSRDELLLLRERVEEKLAA